MSNKNEVYYIVDISPASGYYPMRDKLIGCEVELTGEIGVWPEDSPTPEVRGWSYGECIFFIPKYPTIDTFFAVKLSTTDPSKKSFWQKLITWSWRNE